MWVQFTILLVFSLVAFYQDARYKKIPNWLTGSGILLGFILAIIRYSFFEGLIFSGLGLVVSTVILLLLYFIKGVGAGDVKLFSAIGAIMGTEFSLYSLMYSILFAGFIAVLLLIYRIKFIKRIVARCISFIVEKLARNEQSREEWVKEDISQFPFMYAVLPGVIMTVYLFVN